MNSQSTFLEELSLNAWPSLHTLVYDGWLIRYSNGYTRRANSVNALYSSSLAVDEKISQCEKWYTDRTLPTVYKITPDVHPADLDAQLDQRGYLREAETSVQEAVLTDLPSPGDEQIQLSVALTDEWLTAFCDLNRVDPQNQPTMVSMLNHILPDTCFMSLKRRNEIFAVGLGVLERQYMGLFDIVVAESLRNQGIGTQLVLHLLHWAKDSGADRAYLQVMINNMPAQHLYHKLGFREKYRYWYRVKPLD